MNTDEHGYFKNGRREQRANKIFCTKQELPALYRAHQPYHEPLEKLVPAAP
jgi:hypothetical protein